MFFLKFWGCLRELPDVIAAGKIGACDLPEGGKLTLPLNPSFQPSIAWHRLDQMYISPFHPRRFFPPNYTRQACFIPPIIKFVSAFNVLSRLQHF
jgi:hypothetical protein